MSGRLRREIVRRGEHRLAAQGADAGLFEQFLGLARFFLRALAGLRLGLAPAGARLRVVDQRDGLQQASAFVGGEVRQHVAVGDDGFQQRRSAERRGGKECVSTCISRWSQYHSNKKKELEDKSEQMRS